MTKTRREFVQQVTMVGFGSYLSVAVGACRGRTRTVPSSSSDSGSALGPHKTLTPALYRTLQAACERLLPQDQDPGALDLGVPDYIDHMLATPDLLHWRDLITKLLPVLDRQSKKQFAGRLFHEAAPAEQDLLLKKWQRGASGERRFFEVLFALTLEGAFGDPKYGGNREGRGFNLIGFTPGPPMAAMHHHALPVQR